MDFPFNVGNVLPREINLVDNTLFLSDWKSSTRNKLEYQQLYQIIDAIGEASSFAQGLNRVITTADKIQNSDHLIYLMTEYDDSNKRTYVVGLLKIGRKKLFLLDYDQKTKEVAPLCVLDFYIHESRQRRGYGRKLFEHMLKDQNVHPGYMAIDKPSEKFLSFYATHYGLQKQVPQINHFVVYDMFFNDRPVIAQEAAMTQVNRSNRSSRTASPDCSPAGSRRSSNASSHQFAGKPSRQRDTNIPLYTSFRDLNARAMFLDQHYTSDILHGRNDDFVPSVRCSSKHVTSLDWMRGGPTKEGLYRESRRGYSVSRTPSYPGSPVCRTPRDSTPPRSHPATPPRSSALSSRKQSLDAPDAASPVNGSIAPTPATSPEPRELNGSIKEEREDVESIASHMGNVSIVDEQGKTGGWRDSISRNSEGLIEHMTASKGATMTGVLQENESVHGHLKFHHHALW